MAIASYASKALSWMGSHPGAAGSVIGGLAGGLSSGSVWGMGAGAAIGFGMGRKGWDVSPNSRTNKLSMWYANQAVKRNIVPDLQGMTRFGGIIPTTQKMARGTMIAGAGLGAGIGMRMLGGMVSSVGSSFGNERRSSYGSTFSGMGNGGY